MTYGGVAEIKYIELLKRTAAATGLSLKTVNRIVTAFVKELKRGLLTEGSCHIQTFGTVRLVLERVIDPDRKGPKQLTTAKTRVRIIVRKSNLFKEEAHRYLKDGIMEKYAVDEQVDQKTMEKAAAEGCPLCGRAVVKYGKVIMCPTHGSEPFEKGTDKEE